VRNLTQEAILKQFLDTQLVPNKKITKEEQALFRDSIGDIQKIESDRVILKQPKSKLKRTLKSETIEHHSETELAIQDSVMGERLAYSQPFVTRQTVNALRKGKIESEATLDLHGLTIKQAEQQLPKFMQQSLRHGLFSVHIIHGKGFRSEQNFPVLKNWVNQWLRRQNYVIAFCSAGHHDGGTGAVRVLIVQ
jgi:DNA-nicking Smr family endonuclease